VESSLFPSFSGGSTELTAAMVNGLMDQMRRQGRLLHDFPVEIVQTGEGWQIRVIPQGGIWAICGRQESPGRYAWEEADLAPDGTWVVRVAGKRGEIESAAREAASRDDVAEGTIIWLSPVAGGAAGANSYAFTAPIPQTDPDVFTWAKITGTNGTTHGWVELQFNINTFEEKPGGAVVDPSDPQAAVEVTGATAPVDTVVILYYRKNDASESRLFSFSGSDPGFWAIIARESTEAVYTVSLGGASGGEWDLTFDAGNSPAPATKTGTITIQTTDSSSDIQDALLEYTAGNVQVDGSGDNWTFTFINDLVGESGATLSADFGGLDEADSPSCELTTVGRDLPATDKKGGFAWFRTQTTPFGHTVRGDAGSVWPVGLAIEGNGSRVVPEGSIVWARPRTESTYDLAKAEALPEFADWSDDELAEHFAAVDNGDGTIKDSGVSFLWWGENSFWAKLTDTIIDGQYPFEVVHLGGNELVTPPDEPVDFAETYAQDLRDELLSGDDGYSDLFDSPLSESDWTWVSSRPGGRAITGNATEVMGRTGFAKGTIVRIYASYGSSGITFSFYGPTLSLWATITGTSSGSTYFWEELDPPTVASTGEKADARTGSAREGNGNANVPDDTVVLLEFDSSVGGYRFYYQPPPYEGGRDCRLLHWTGGTTATINASPEDPDSDDEIVTIRFYPAINAESLMAHGYHVGYRGAGDTVYTIPVPFDYATDRVSGYVSTTEQVIPGVWALGSGNLIVTGSGLTNSSPPPNIFSVDFFTTTSSTVPGGHLILTNDGGFHMSDGGPRLIATGGILDLQGAVWAGSTAAGTSSSFVTAARDGVTGTFPIVPKADGTPGSITFKGGLFVSATPPGAPSALWTGTFECPTLPHFFAHAVVHVVDGLVVDITSAFG
jgi:hypothetical protein